MLENISTSYNNLIKYLNKVVTVYDLNLSDRFYEL